MVAFGVDDLREVEIVVRHTPTSRTSVIGGGWCGVGGGGGGGVVVGTLVSKLFKVKMGSGGIYFSASGDVRPGVHRCTDGRDLPRTAAPLTSGGTWVHITR